MKTKNIVFIWGCIFVLMLLALIGCSNTQQTPVIEKTNEVPYDVIRVAYQEVYYFKAQDNHHYLYVEYGEGVSMVHAAGCPRVH